MHACIRTDGPASGRRAAPRGARIGRSSSRALEAFDAPRVRVHDPVLAAAGVLVEVNAAAPPIALLELHPSVGARVEVLLVAAILRRQREVGPETFVLHRKPRYLLVCKQFLVQQPLGHGLQALFRGLGELHLQLPLELLLQILEVDFPLSQAIVDVRYRLRRVNILEGVQAVAVLQHPLPSLLLGLEDTLSLLHVLLRVRRVRVVPIRPVVRDAVLREAALVHGVEPLARELADGTLAGDRHDELVPLRDLLVGVEARGLHDILVHEARADLQQLPLEVCGDILLHALVGDGRSVPLPGLCAENVRLLLLLHLPLRLQDLRLHVFVVKELLRQGVIDLVAVRAPDLEFALQVGVLRRRCRGLHFGLRAPSRLGGPGIQSWPPLPAYIV
mmetsp:Transcript_104755/g.263777  ORF Transcript_104755/g.263777 Transcript_104755/m.263777 type:complete len:389 (+) Transcript_104755:2-1168(+)